MGFRLFLIGLIIGISLGGVAYGNRISKPQRITSFDEKGLVALNEALENLWDVTNGRFSPSSGADASTGTGTVKMGSASNANSAGFLKFEKSNGMVVYVPYFSTDSP